MPKRSYSSTVSRRCVACCVARKMPAAPAAKRVPRERDGHVGDHAQRGVHRVGMAAQVGVQPIGRHLARGGERAEHRLQDRHRAVELARSRAQRLVLPAPGPGPRVESREARPVPGAPHGGNDHLAGADRVAAVLGHGAPVDDAVGARRHELHDVEVPPPLPGDHVRGELRRIEVVAGEVPPQAERDDVGRSAGDRGLDALPMGHRLHAAHCGRRRTQRQRAARANPRRRTPFDCATAAPGVNPSRRLRSAR